MMRIPDLDGDDDDEDEDDDDGDDDDDDDDDSSIDLAWPDLVLAAKQSSICNCHRHANYARVMVMRVKMSMTRQLGW